VNELVNATNGVMQLRHFQRRVPRPDLLFSTADFSSQNTVITYSNTVDNASEFFTLTVTGFGVALGFNNFAYNSTGRPGNQAGPGTIIDDDPLPTLYILNRQFPIFQNTQASGTIFTTEAAQLPIGGWGSFDGTTNAPVVYPNGSSVGHLEDLMFAPAPATPTLPDGYIGQPYAAQLLGKNGTPPYTWSLAPNSPALPDGLNISSDGQITGVPSGPTAIYDFTLRITDSAGKFRDVQYTITIF
jgi:hypothetical protein